MGVSSNKKKLSKALQTELLNILESRFVKNESRHPDLEWAVVKIKLESKPEKIWSLNEMERTGGEPDVVGIDDGAGEYVFFDCSAETPNGRVSLCYDRAGLESRKVNKPKDTVIDMAEEMGMDLLTVEQYLELQKVGEFDKKTSSWVGTPAEIRSLGGALYCELRYGQVFTGHNGAQSYYASRGFRGCLRV